MDPSRSTVHATPSFIWTIRRRSQLEKNHDQVLSAKYLVRSLERGPGLKRIEEFTPLQRAATELLAYTVAVYFPWGAERELQKPRVARWAKQTADRIAHALTHRDDGWWHARCLGKAYRAMLFHTVVQSKIPTPKKRRAQR